MTPWRRSHSSTTAGRDDKFNLMTPVQRSFHLLLPCLYLGIPFSPITFDRDVLRRLSPAPSPLENSSRLLVLRYGKEAVYIPKYPFPHIPESKKTENQRTDAFKLWCWRRLLRVPWTARRSNQSILKEINTEYSLEGLKLKLKLQYFGHLMRRADSLEKTLMLRKTEGGRRRG